MRFTHPEAGISVVLIDLSRLINCEIRFFLHINTHDDDLSIVARKQGPRTARLDVKGGSISNKPVRFTLRYETMDGLLHALDVSVRVVSSYG